jgi:hypothetical protein
MEPNWSEIEFVVGLMQTEADEGDETREVFNDGSDGDTTVENWSSSSCSSVYWQKVPLLYHDLFAFEKNSPCCFELFISMLFFAMIFCFVFTTIPITMKTCYVFFTWKHFQFLEARISYAVGNLKKKSRNWEKTSMRIMLSTRSAFVVDAYVFSFFLSPSFFRSKI